MNVTLSRRPKSVKHSISKGVCSIGRVCLSTTEKIHALIRATGPEVAAGNGPREMMTRRSQAETWKLWKCSRRGLNGRGSRLDADENIQ